MSGVERADLAEQEDWHQFANCATADPDVMFPEKGDGRGSRMAKKVCEGCIVVDECLTEAIEHPELYGIRGGKTPHEIQALRRDYYAQQRAEAQEAHRAKYDRAVAMRDSGMTKAAIARALGYRWPSGVTGLLNSYANEQEAAS